jgi:hypothetical protein
MNSFWVSLTDEEKERGWEHGIAQEKDSIARGLQNQYGAKPTTEKSERWGCLSGITEVALRVAFGMPLDLSYGVGRIADLPGDVQVKLLSGKDAGLPIRTGDKPEWKSVGVVIPKYQGRYLTKYEIMNFPHFRIAGWYFVDDARAQAGSRPDLEEYGYPHCEWWTDPDKSRPKEIFIPQSFLRPMDELVTILRGEGIPIDTSRVIQPFS